MKEFIDAIIAAGITPPEKIRDTRGVGPIRFKSHRQDFKKSGWYVFFDDDHPAGEFGCNRTGIRQKWCAKSYSELSDVEKDNWKKKMDLAREKSQQAERERRNNSSVKVKMIFEKAKTEGITPYMQRKGVTSLYGARIDHEKILVPMYANRNSLVGLQIIYDDGDKQFMFGSILGGSYFVIGRPDLEIVICEGYATAVSIHESTGYCTVIAFSATNLQAVALKIRDKFPDKKIILAADDDYMTAENPGVKFATKAAQASGGSLVVPIWQSDRPEKSTDFNDLYLQEGKGGVLTAFKKIISLCTTIDDSEASMPVLIDPVATKPKVHKVASNYVDKVILYNQYLPDVNDKGRPLATDENFSAMVDRIGLKIDYNIISRKINIQLPGRDFTGDNAVIEQDSYIKGEMLRFKIPITDYSTLLVSYANQHQYNPVRHWIESTPWDGRDRVGDLLDTIEILGDNEHGRILITTWLRQAVFAAYSKIGVKSEGTLVFQGAQGVGKSSWFNALTPRHLNLSIGGITLKPDDKDSMLRVCSFWLVEMAELDGTLRKSDMGVLKAFLDRDTDNIRAPFMPKASNFARRTVFFSSVNDERFLVDKTGNRRFWVVNCGKIDWQHGINMQQMWAQVADEVFNQHLPHVLDSNSRQKSEIMNKNHEVIGLIEEMLSIYYDWDSPKSTWRELTATQVLKELSEKNYTTLTIQPNRVSVAIKSVQGGVAYGYRILRGISKYKIPPLLSIS